MNAVIKEFGGLTCRLIDQLPEGKQPERLIVLCHGFGAPGDDLAAFGPHLLQEKPSLAETTLFVFPAAPIDMSAVGIPGGRAWWQINMAALAQMHETRDYSDLNDVTPEGMQEATDQLEKCLEEIAAATGVPAEQTTLGGFSQGAMITTNLTLRSGTAFERLVLFSGTLVRREAWEQAATEHPGCPVLQSHGRQDMVLPFESAEKLRDLLDGGNFDVTFIPFSGGHEIPHPVLDGLLEVL